jgi:tRNA threonylcarbamoyladenosine biosynthesis protein TsaE
MKVQNAAELTELGLKFGAQLKGGEVVELIGDVGSGKTTFTQGIALALGVNGPVNSPSFTIMKSYPAKDGLTLNHYDFYRLDGPGIMQAEIAESLGDSSNITVIEWAKGVAGVLPDERKQVVIKFLPNSAEGREVIL